jgi:hypothetical protein
MGGQPEEAKFVASQTLLRQCAKYPQLDCPLRHWMNPAQRRLFRGDASHQLRHFIEMSFAELCAALGEDHISVRIALRVLDRASNEFDRHARHRFDRHARRAVPSGKHNSTTDTVACADAVSPNTMRKREATGEIPGYRHPAKTYKLYKRSGLEKRIARVDQSQTPHYLTENEQREQSEELLPCPECGGLGAVGGGDQCPLCAGSGYAVDGY